MHFPACGSFICVLICRLCVFLLAKIFVRYPIFTFLATYLCYQLTLLGVQFISKCLTHMLNFSCIICLSAFQSGFPQSSSLIFFFLFSHIEYFAENGKHTSPLANCAYCFVFLMSIAKNECN